MHPVAAGPAGVGKVELLYSTAMGQRAQFTVITSVQVLLFVVLDVREVATIQQTLPPPDARKIAQTTDAAMFSRIIGVSVSA
jgi:hypothetical protein